MYINEVLRTCDMLCPNEYFNEEKYMWCDELSAMIANEHLKKYDRITLEAGQDGSYLLPDGVTFEMVDRIIDGAREIDKRDFRSYGIEYYYGACGRFVLPARHRANNKIDVVYLKKHTPIRRIDIEGVAKFKHNGFYTQNTELTEGDSVNIKADGKTFELIPLLGVEAVESGNFFITVPDDTFNTLLLSDQTERDIKAVISLIITDETLCDAPYDSMYIDFVNAKICYYQRDFDTYNQHMNLFNQRMAAYQAWLQQRRVQDRDGMIMNWI